MPFKFKRWIKRILVAWKGWPCLLLFCQITEAQPSATATGAANPQPNGLGGQQALEKDYEIANGVSMV